jgi:HEAT repeat protein
MLTLIFAGLLALPAAAQGSSQGDPHKAQVDPKEIEQAVARLEAAFKTGGTTERVAAIEAGALVPAEKVADGIAEGLKDKEPPVVLAAVEALGRMDSDAALARLEKHFEQHKKRLEKEPAVFAAVLKACARHGKSSSIPLLQEDLFAVRDYGVVQARILGLGNIRSKESIEALVAMSAKTGPNNLDRYMDELRLALFNITGVDQGKSPQLWGKWWQDNKKTFVVPEKPPELPPDLRGRWNHYWGIGDKERKPQDGGSDGKQG